MLEIRASTRPTSPEGQRRNRVLAANRIAQTMAIPTITSLAAMRVWWSV